MTDLKNCPFCGGEAEVVDSGMTGAYRVACKSCSCEVSAGVEGGADKTWNARARDTSLDGHLVTFHADQHIGEKPPGTVTVRIPVAVYPDGEWGAEAKSVRSHDSNLRYLLGSWDEEGRSIICITDEVPVPEPNEVEGRVE